MRIQPHSLNCEKLHVLAVALILGFWLYAILQKDIEDVSTCTGESVTLVHACKYNITELKPRFSALALKNDGLAKASVLAIAAYNCVLRMRPQ